MARVASSLAGMMLALTGSAALARDVVDASAPQATSVTLYRDPHRGVGEAMDRTDPRGFAMITETRQVTLPPGESTIRFVGVAEGMVAVSAIVTGLPGGTIEKNRNAALLSPAALVDGTLGNRVTITRTNPATGTGISEQAIIRTRADGGLVLQTSAGFEAVRCSGLPEKLTFDRVPAGLSAQPVFSVDTRSAAGGTYTVQLTYLSWGFDWQAHYVATLAPAGRDDAVQMGLISWLTLLNDNAQSFADAELLVVAGELSVVSDFGDLAEPPVAQPLNLTCYPLGSTAAGSPALDYTPPPPPSAPMIAEGSIVVTAQMRSTAAFDSVTPMVAVMATEEDLGDLKLYRVPVPVTVSAKAVKQVAFLDEERVTGRLIYEAGCNPRWQQDQPSATRRLLITVNDKNHGLGAALPQGGITFFEPAETGLQLVAEDSLRDHASGQDLEVELGDSSQVFSQCERVGGAELGAGWERMRATFSNANPGPVTVRLTLGPPAEFTVKGLRGTQVKDGQRIVEVTIPGNGRRGLDWRMKAVPQ